jgi:hypothetical protein
MLAPSLEPFGPQNPSSPPAPHAHLLRSLISSTSYTSSASVSLRLLSRRAKTEQNESRQPSMFSYLYKRQSSQPIHFQCLPNPSGYSFPAPTQILPAFCTVAGCATRRNARNSFRFMSLLHDLRTPGGGGRTLRSPRDQRCPDPPKIHPVPSASTGPGPPRESVPLLSTPIPDAGAPQGTQCIERAGDIRWDLRHFAITNI